MAHNADITENKKVIRNYYEQLNCKLENIDKISTWGKCLKLLKTKG